MAASLQRHDLVWLDPDHPGLVACDPATLGLVRDWLAAGRPCIVRRRDAGDDPRHLPLGLPLPIRLGRRRISLAAPAGALRRVAPPPTLREAAAGLPADWRPAARTLVDRLADCGAEGRVFGSAAWQWLTGERYLRPGSDLDLLVAPGRAGDGAALLRALAPAAAQIRPRIDAEIALGDGGCVAWRELLRAGRQILVKGTAAAELRCRREVERRLGLDR